MTYWHWFLLALSIWLVLRYTLKVRLNVLAGILVYGLLRVAYHQCYVALSLILDWEHKRHEREPERPKVANCVSDLVSVHNLHKPLEVVLGFNGKRPIKVNFEKHHTLVGSSTGGGKTNVLNAILIQLFGKGKRFSSQCDVYLIDLKGDENDYLHLWRPLLAGYAGIDERGGIGNAIALLETIIHAMRYGDGDKRILLVIDEIAVLTHQTLDRDERDTAIRLLTIILSQLRSRGAVIMAVQYPRFDVIPTPIRGNADRKIMLPVDSRDHARVILGFRPNEDDLPIRPGEFLLKEPGVRGLQKGQAMLVELPGEVDKAVFANLDSYLDDSRLKLLHDITAGKQPGALVDGIVKVARSRKDYPQDWVQTAYRNYALAGALTPPGKRGESYILASDYQVAIGLVKEYIERGDWKSEPDSFVGENGNGRKVA